MRIRKDLGGCVYVQGRRLFAGDPVPEGAVVSDWLLDEDGQTADEHDTQDSTGTDEGEGEGQAGTDDEETENQEPADDEGNDSEKPNRSDSKADWFAYAESAGLVKEDSTVEDYTKDELIELVG